MIHWDWIAPVKPKGNPKEDVCEEPLVEDQSGEAHSKSNEGHCHQG